MKKTALQELIEHLETHLLRLDVPDMVYQINEAIKKAKTLLPKEREDLEEAYYRGKTDYKRGAIITSTDYVDQTFGTYESKSEKKG